MRLAELIGESGLNKDLEITGLTADSREVRPGYLFAAFAGTKTDGAGFIADAIARGAVTILAVPDAVLPEGPEGKVYHLASVNPRRRFAALAARFYGPQPETVVAVTGTNGKTSVASFTRQIWQYLGQKAASVGTLGVAAAGYDAPLALTTPDPVTFHRALQDLRARGVTHVACEASSHGLAQYRLDGLKVQAAAFTNLTRDHMDYHTSEDAYFFAKARLFGELMAPGGVAVLNMGDAHAAELESLCWARGHRLIRVGADEGEIRLMARHPVEGGQALTVAVDGEILDLTLPLVGGFQAMNALVAAGLVIACGGAPGAVLRALETLEAVPGRLELAARHPSGAQIFVDYAHTPDALGSVLSALRPHVQGRLSVVFGCGGDRDRGKRPQMGRIASELADVVYVTDDNPRTEDAAAIRQDILAACPTATEIGDRRAAIAAAVAALTAGDILVVAGKGHETGQIVGAEVREFNDMAEVRAAVAEQRS